MKQITGFVFLVIFFTSCFKSELKKIKDEFVYKHKIKGGFILKDSVLVIIRKYDLNGNVILEKDYNVDLNFRDTTLNLKALYKYTRFGKLEEESRYDNNEKLFYKKLIEYNSFKKIKSIRIYCGINPFDSAKLILVAKSDITYNNKGKLLEKTFCGKIDLSNNDDFSNDKVPTDVSTAKYIYDSKNRIDSIIIDNNSMTISESTYKIMSNPFGINNKENKLNTEFIWRRYKYLQLHPEDSITNYDHYFSTEIHKRFYDNNDTNFKYESIMELRRYGFPHSDKKINNYIKLGSKSYEYKENKLHTKITDSDTLKTTVNYDSNGNILKKIKYDKLNNNILETRVFEYNNNHDLIRVTLFDYLNEPKEHYSSTFEYW